MKKFSFSKPIMFSASEIKSLKTRGNKNTPYAKTLTLRVGEGFVVYVNRKKKLVYLTNKLRSWESSSPQRVITVLVIKKEL
jgi:hypothetical protein